MEVIAMCEFIAHMALAVPAEVKEFVCRDPARCLTDGGPDDVGKSGDYVRNIRIRLQRCKWFSVSRGASARDTRITW